MKVTLYFTEIEHGGDLQQAINAISSNNGTIVETNPNYDAETAEIIVETNENPQEFKKAVYATYWQND